MNSLPSDMHYTQNVWNILEIFFLVNYTFQQKNKELSNNNNH